MVFLTVPAARFLKALLENHPSLTAVAKAQMRRFCWHLFNLLRKGLWGRPIDSRYSIYRLCDWAWFSCVAPVTALSRAVAAAMRSAMIIFFWAVVQPESDGKAERGSVSVRFLVSSESLRSKSRERALARLFSFPGNHWEYPWWSGKWKDWHVFTQFWDGWLPWLDLHLLSKNLFVLAILQMLCCLSLIRRNPPVGGILMSYLSKVRLWRRWIQESY